MVKRWYQPEILPELKNLRTQKLKNPISHLYLHIPFCRRACNYCDFHFSTNLQSKTDVVSAIIKEIYLRKDYLSDNKLNTIYFGGGTPSLLNINELHDIFETIHHLFEVDKNAEITLEANPDDITKERLLIWQRFGINRLSIGIQSFNNDYLKYMNRIHTSKMALDCVQESQDVGITNLSVDLIYGVNPNNYKQPKRKPRNPPPVFSEQEMHNVWNKDLKTVFGLGVQHISSYCLTIEEKTVFGSWLKNKQIVAIDDGFAATQFRTLQKQMQANGFEQYEVSNFAKDGKYAVHNTSYWSGESYLGVGPSAHSFDGNSRQFNVASNTAYMKSLDEHIVPFQREILTPENRFNELLMTGLRTIWGVSTERLKESGIIIPDEFYKTIKSFENQEKLTFENGVLKLTNKGKFFADGIAAELFV
ncbi:MAG: coproporphyrinogen III oxidase family protein [Spirosomaceae bacterium]|nr:coproporphyrinogen III oxidase family protein [Spirosomataceae bacterium]